MSDPELIILGYGAQVPARALQRDVERGLLHRIRPGVYLERARWDSADPEERLRLQARGLGAQQPNVVFAGATAAVLHGLPLLWPLPARPEIVQRRSKRTPSTPRVIHRSSERPADPVLVHGLAVTPVERTAVDLAAQLSFRAALVPLDAALRRGLRRTALLDELDAAGPRAMQRATTAITWADKRSATPGESLARANLLEFGCPVPHLQLPIRGTPYEVDFGLLEYGWIGEFDGHMKYRQAEYRRGRSPAEVVIEEKRREDEIRAITGARFLRWTWDDALRIAPMQRSLLRAGIPRSPWRAAPRSL